MIIFVGNRAWNFKMVPASDDRLIDRTGARTLGVTDVLHRTVCLDGSLRGEKLRKVFLHELGHCMMASYGYLHEVHRVVPKEYWLEAEEWICNFLAEHSVEAVGILRQFWNEEV